jgi:hypothetical protein
MLSKLSINCLAVFIRVAVLSAELRFFDKVVPPLLAPFA